MACHKQRGVPGGEQRAGFGNFRQPSPGERVGGGTFTVNLILARTQTKEEYGMFPLSYSFFTFLAGLHNAAILEPYTVFGSGRHRARFPE